MANPVPVSYSSPVQKVGGGREIFPNASLDLIAAAPENSWVLLSSASWQSIWLPNDERVEALGGPLTPRAIVMCWASFAYDT